MTPYKDCSCRNPETGRRYGKGKCPKLGRRHGAYYVRYEAPRSSDGKRRQPLLGPFATEKECKEELTRALGQSKRSTNVDDRKLLSGTYLERRLSWRIAEHEAGGGLKKSTLDAEREAIELYFKPGIGHLKLVDLRERDIRDLYATMRLINRPDAEVPPDLSELLRRLLSARATRDGRRVSTRPLSEARIRRMHAVLTGALNNAVPKILDVNPADGVLQSKGGGRKGRVRPLLWTDERVEYWQRTGKVPGKVMVWTSPQCGAFLDFVEHDRLYPLWHFGAYYGTRRGELVGLERQNLSVDRRRVHLLTAQQGDELDETKTEASTRHIVFDTDTAAVLRAWLKVQLEERMRWGEAWTDSGRVFTYEDGRELRPAHISQRFEALCDRYRVIQQRRAEGWSVEKIARHYRAAGGVVRIAIEGSPLPPIRFHDLRHGAATMLIAAGVDDKLVSDVLGHASVSFTKDSYAVVAEELAEAAATKIAAFVPRRNRA